MNKNIVISYNTLRKIVGLLGLAFPIILILGSVIVGDCSTVQSSISSYYHTVMRDVFVGTLCIVGFFMFAYNGYDRTDRIAGNLACFFALGVAFFPTGVEPPANSCAFIPEDQNPIISKIHYIFAACLFLTLTFFAFFLFTKSNGTKTIQKKKRNVIFKICGLIMLICIILLACYFVWGEHTSLNKLKPVFYLEGIALWAFGISWLVKGEFLLKDKE